VGGLGWSDVSDTFQLVRTACVVVVSVSVEAEAEAEAGWYPLEESEEEEAEGEDSWKGGRPRDSRGSVGSGRLFFMVV